MRLPKEFYQATTLQIAQRLLGKRLVRQTEQGSVSGWIVEVEAYLWRGDPACHAARGMTPRNQAMFGPPGSLYVYAIHAQHCMNVVTEVEGKAAAVLIRALEPIEGVELMRHHRQTNDLHNLTNGPGKLCRALDIDRRFNAIDLTTHQQLWIEESPPRSRWAMHRSGRIGISLAKDRLWRFFIDGNRFVSGRASDHRVPRQYSLHR